MPLRRAFRVVALLASASTLAQALAQAPASDLAQWRKGYADQLSRPDGWLSLVALEWLKEGDTSVGSASDNAIRLSHVPAHVGILRQKGKRIEFLAPPEGVSQAVLLDGKPAAGGFLNADDNEHPSVLATGSVQMTVIHRGGRYYLRVKDAMAPARLHFAGLHWYPEVPRLRITAKWIPSSPPKTLHIVNVLGQTDDEPSPGRAEFQIDGQTVSLEPVVEGDVLFFDFRDATSKSTTDGAGRFLTAPLPSNGVAAPGTVVLDFNRAHNPPCGYTPYATCPLPTESNRLAVSIPAGEKRFGND